MGRKAAATSSNTPCLHVQHERDIRLAIAAWLSSQAPLEVVCRRTTNESRTVEILPTFRCLFDLSIFRCSSTLQLFGSTFRCLPTFRCLSSFSTFRDFPGIFGLFDLSTFCHPTTDKTKTSDASYTNPKLDRKQLSL